MRISHFFIDRPIFAAVLSIVFVILGGVAFTRLPVAQYPEIAPPVINITGQYPGASAETVAETVVAPIEQQVNGVEGMLYISSNSTRRRPLLDRGHLRPRHQSRYRAGAGAEPRRDRDSRDCRSQVQQIGVTVAKSSPDILMVVNLYLARQVARRDRSCRTTPTSRSRTC